MIFFFSGTGKSLWATKVLGEKTGQPIKSISVYKKVSYPESPGKAV